MRTSPRPSRSLFSERSDGTHCNHTARACTQPFAKWCSYASTWTLCCARYVTPRRTHCTSRSPSVGALGTVRRAARTAACCYGAMSLRLQNELLYHSWIYTCPLTKRELPSDHLPRWGVHSIERMRCECLPSQSICLIGGAFYPTHEMRMCPRLSLPNQVRNAIGSAFKV